MKNIICKYLMVVLLGVSVPSDVCASLLISPIRTIIEGRDRSASIVLFNTTDQKQVYSLSWFQLKQVQDLGGYIVDEDTDETLNLQDFAVFTPRQITLEPSSKQTIRVGIRRPADLPDGEYKSHLKIASQPTEAGPEIVDAIPGGVGVGAKVINTHSVPVIYRKGEYDVSVSVEAPTFTLHDGTGNLIVNLPILRSGVHGVIGFIEVLYIPNNGEPSIIGTMSGVNMFPEITRRNIEIPTTLSGLAPGTLNIRFLKDEGARNDRTMLDEKSFPIIN